tara:strand:- start:40 stop:669 length:630 start_codon:yes stop_codon:yes gene_type:complete
MTVKVYENMLPVCTLTPEEHGIDLDYKKIVKLIEKLEPEVLKIEGPQGIENKKPGTDDEMIIKWNLWNILLLNEPELFKVYKIILKGIKEFAEFTNLNESVTYLGCWATLTRKGKKVHPHTHNFLLVGHLVINAEPSITTFSWKDSDDKLYHVPIENKNGQVLVTSSVNHHSSVWEKDESRVTIGFDVIGEKHFNDPRPLPLCFPIFLE